MSVGRWSGDSAANLSGMRRYLDRMERETVVVHTKSGTSIRGVLIAVYKDCLVLVSAAHLSDSGPTNVDGEAIILRCDVDWIQRLAAAGGDLT